MTNTVSSCDAVSVAAGSFLVPGLGQWIQGRRAAAIYFFGDTLAGLALGVWVPEVRGVAWALAGAIAIWSIVDAAIVARRTHPPAV
jgi:hypothetical protein